MRKISKIIIHCAATPADLDVGAAEIRQWHTLPPPKGNGWADIGYHFVIRRDGRVEDGRPLERQGAHCAAKNGNVASIGICLVGGVRRQGSKLIAEDNFTAEQWQELRRLVAAMTKRFPGIDTILGHRDLDPGKACPSFSVRDWLIRERIREITWA